MLRKTLVFLTMAKCSFCSELIPHGQGLILALNDGRVLHFCSSKCYKNKKLNRSPKKLKWVTKKKQKSLAELKEEILEEAEEEAAEAKEKQIIKKGVDMEAAVAEAEEKKKKEQEAEAKKKEAGKPAEEKKKTEEAEKQKKPA